MSGLKELVSAGLSHCRRGIQDHWCGSPMCSMYLALRPMYSLFSLTACGNTFTGTGRCLSFSKDGQVLFQASVTGRCTGQLLGRTLPALHAPHTAYVAAVAPLTLRLWHERLNYRSMDAVEGLTSDSNARPQHHCPPCAAGKQGRDPFPPLSTCALWAFELVHTDLSGPAHVPGAGGIIYRLTISPAGAGSSCSPTSARRPSWRHSRSTRQ